MSGWIKDHRKELKSDVWQMPPLYHRVWQWIKYQVNHDDAVIPMANGTKLSIRPGQHLTSIRNIAQGVGWYEGALWKEPNPKTIDKILEWFEKNNMISISRGRGNRQYTLITLINWGNYQGSDSGGVTANGEGSGEGTGYKQEGLKNDNKNEKNKRSSSRNKKITYNEDNAYYQMSLYFHQKIMDHAAQNKKAHLVENADLQKWSDEFRKIVELDKRDKLELKRVIDWATADSFWQLNILSPTNLRKQYVQLAVKMDPAPSNSIRQTAKQQKKQQEMEIIKQLYMEGLENETNGHSENVDYHQNGLPEF